MFAQNLSNKIFSPPRHQDTKLNYIKQLLFVSLCLCGYSIRLCRVGLCGRYDQVAGHDLEIFVLTLSSFVPDGVKQPAGSRLPIKPVRKLVWCSRGARLGRDCLCTLSRFSNDFYQIAKIIRPKNIKRQE